MSVESNVSFPTSALPASDNVLKPSRVCLISSIENSPDSMTSPIASKMSKLKNSAFDEMISKVAAASSAWSAEIKPSEMASLTAASIETSISMLSEPALLTLLSIWDTSASDMLPITSAKEGTAPVSEVCAIAALERSNDAPIKVEIFFIRIS